MKRVDWIRRVLPCVASAAILFSFSAMRMEAQVPAGVDCSTGSGCNFAGQYSGKITVIARTSSSDGYYQASYTIAVKSGVAGCEGKIEAKSKSAEEGARYYKDASKLPFNGAFGGRAKKFWLELPSFESTSGEYDIAAVCPGDYPGASVDLPDLQSSDFSHLEGSESKDWESDEDNGIKGTISYKWDLRRGDKDCSADSAALEAARKAVDVAARDAQSSFLQVRSLSAQLSTLPNVAAVSTFLRSQETTIISAYAARGTAPTGSARDATNAAYGQAMAKVMAQQVANMTQISAAATPTSPVAPVDARLSQLRSAMTLFSAHGAALQSTLGVEQKAAAGYAECLAR